MGFRPVDDSDLDPKSKRRESSSHSSEFRSPGDLDSNHKSMKKEGSSAKSGMGAAKFGDEETPKRKSGSKSKKKGKKSKKRAGVGSYIWTFVKVFGTTVGVFVLLVGILIGCAMFGVFGDGAEVDIASTVLGENSVVYYIDAETGEEVKLCKLSSGDRNQQYVAIDKIPKNMKNAFVAIEDERFYDHSGVDLLRTSKATIMYVWGKITGSGSDFGGSTITQQYIKNATGNWENSPARKIKEISQAVTLEKKMSKDEILEGYLNIINLSNNCYGVGAASMEIFGKPVQELNLAECACIAGITQNPTKYDPIRNPKDNKAKQEIVLKKMLELEYINQKQYDEAVKYKLKFNKSSEDSGKVEINPYYVEQITSELTREFMDMGYSRELAYYKATMGGLKIITTIDKNLQDAIDAVYGNPEECARLFGYEEGASKNPQSAIVVLSPDGGICGIYGGLGEKKANLILNRTTIPRQPGSSIKPISVYAPAIDEEIIHASTLYKDGVMTFDGKWTPSNSYSDTGDKTVQVAIQRSSNRIAAQVLQDLGVSESYSHLRDKLGVTSLVEDDKNLPALSLGGMTKGISPLEMAGAYTPFINKGVYTRPHIYTKVYDNKGNIILENNPEKHQAISSKTAYIMTQLLRRVVTSGTGTLANLNNGVFAAGKTGTTDANKDKWFVGFTPNYVCAVWHGYDENEVVSSTYASGAQLAFKAVMDKVHEKIEVKSISAPSGIVNISVCSQSGHLASDDCTAISLPFTSDNKPKKKCWHKVNELLDDDGNEILDLDIADEEVEDDEPSDEE